MNFQQFSDCQRIIIKVLKSKYINMTTDEAVTMATEILNGLINYLDIKQQ